MTISLLAGPWAASATDFSTLDINKCERASEAAFFHGGRSGYEDLSNSLVMYQNSASYESGGYLDVVLVHCRSGERLTLRAGQRERDNIEFDRTEETLGAVRGFAKSKQSYRFEELRELFSEKGIDASLDVSTNEICPCKALYPKDRLTKTPYVWESPWGD